jgi:hypothetical protein
LANFMRLSLRKGAYDALSGDAWQEIQVRSGRDDNSLGERERFPTTEFVGSTANGSNYRIVIPTGA